MRPQKADVYILTLAMIQQMSVFVFTALGLQGTSTNASSRIIDLGASNHMTGSVTGFHGVCKYGVEQHIQIADGSTLPITNVGNLGSSFRNVCLSWIIY